MKNTVKGNHFNDFSIWTPVPVVVEIVKIETVKVDISPGVPFN